MSMLALETSTKTGISAVTKSNDRSKSTEGFGAVEKRRRTANVTRAALAREAGIGECTYRRIASRQQQPQRRILIRLNAALDRLAGKPAPTSPDIIAGLYRAALVAFAIELSADVQLALKARSLSNLDDGNRRAGLARRLAFYVTVNAFDVPRPDVSRAVGYSKQAASKALREVEDARGEKADLNALILRVGDLLTGRDLT